MITELTQSLLNQMAKCPHQVYLSRVRGIIIPPGIAARKGSSVHKGAEVIHRAKVAGSDVTPDDAADATRDEFRRLVIEEGVMLTLEEKGAKNEALNAGLNEAISAVRAYRKGYAPGLDRIALIEERLYADVDAGLPISGKPDVVADSRLIDIKTAGKRWSAGTEHTELQPTMYRLLLKRNGFDPLPAEYVILSPAKKAPDDPGVIHDKDESVAIDIRPTERTDAQETKLIARCRAVADQIKAGNFPPGPANQWWCTAKFCGFYGTVCKYV